MDKLAFAPAGHKRTGGPTPARRLLVMAWAAPTSLVGLTAALVARHWRRREGLLEAWGGGLAWLLRRVPLPGGASAMALGHVVLGRDLAALDRWRAHERVHVGQAERWGPLFVPAYLLAGAWQAVRGRHPYRDNPFEVEARAGGGVPPAARAG